mmetsp:Transcript_14978/g.26940  ORF Transcript_14978/g.26940 Transcript_14978/m.26940 type:complete len:411 (-) Transcript_14978:207-1439(-)|eukprot:CAMPEP_0197525574 /NCGR_PEP_ID=MMETSP1318-20131121/12906_1 /TAXON_ID=552666 /ORGANISM="Partenskyella glossopodia, Strain RCC365" /LENGTH=410 /DNA_ID=CAMNT_0043079111 /DNA_START=128 /DNA_END=1360 /DNA_ORIENTATION=-
MKAHYRSIATPATLLCLASVVGSVWQDENHGHGLHEQQSLEPSSSMHSNDDSVVREFYKQMPECKKLGLSPRVVHQLKKAQSNSSFFSRMSRTEGSGKTSFFGKKRRVVDPKKNQVQFVIGGTQKGGSSYLSALIANHPNITIRQTEQHFFDVDYRSKSFEDYRKSTCDNSDPRTSVCGEKTPNYMLIPSAVDRIARDFPSMKWVLVLRNPVERAMSQYKMNDNIRCTNYIKKTVPSSLSFFEEATRKASKNMDIVEEQCMERYGDKLPEEASFGSSFEEALQMEINEEHHNFTGVHLTCSFKGYCFYLQRGFYMQQIRYLLAKFPRDQIHVILNEDMRDPQHLDQEALFQFLGVPFTHRLKHDNIFESKKKTQMLDETKKCLYEVFKEPNRQLFDFLGTDVPESWKHDA